MSRLAVLFAIAGVALSATPENLSTSLVYGTTGSFITRDVFVNFRRFPFEVRATSRVALATSRPQQSATDISIRHDTNVSSTIINFQAPTYSESLPWSVLGIAAQSELTQQAGPISILREPTSAQMVLYSTFEHFAAACVPDSILTVTNASSLSGVQFKLMNESFSESFGNYTVALGHMYFYRLSVPELLKDRITEILTPTGASSSFGEFYHCSRQSLALLPNIQVTFETGSLVYYPEDYVDFNEEEQTCMLRVARSEEEVGFGIDPLKLVGQNVRVTRNNIWNICESAAMG
jgi:hypothetical protein